MVKKRRIGVGKNKNIHFEEENKKVIDSELVQQAISYGVYDISKRHPVFENNTSLISKYIDPKEVNKKLSEIYTEIEYKGIRDEDEKKEYLVKSLANSTAAGELFDKKGLSIILGKGLEEKVGFVDKLKDKFSFGTNKLKGGNYLTNKINAFRDLYELAKSGKYGEIAPEITNAAKNIEYTDFLDKSIDILRSWNVINQSNYIDYKKKLKERVDKETEETITSIEKYILPSQKAAAAIFWGAGILFILFSGLRITGNVVGNNYKNAGLGIAGLLLIIIAVVLFLKARKGKRKSVRGKRRK